MPPWLLGLLAPAVTSVVGGALRKEPDAPPQLGEVPQGGGGAGKSPQLMSMLNGLRYQQQQQNEQRKAEQQQLLQQMLMNMIFGGMQGAGQQGQPQGAPQGPGGGSVSVGPVSPVNHQLGNVGRSILPQNLRR